MKAAIWIFILVSLVSSAYYLGGQSLVSITGLVVSEESNGEYGKYYYQPDFRIPLTVELERYDELRQAARSLVLSSWDCEETEDLENCINSLKKPGWSVDCDTNEEKILTDVAEKYMQCASSKDNYCLCEIELGTYDIGEYDLTIEENTGTFFNLGDYSHFFKDVKPDLSTNTGSIIRNSDTYGRYELSLEYDDRFNKVKLEEAKVTVYKNDKIYTEIEYEDKIYYFKINNTMILVSPEQHERSIEESETDPTVEIRNCWLPNKRIYKFCANSGRTLHVKDGTVGDHELIYRFAMDFSDDEAPAQTQILGVKNIDKTKQSLLVTWQASTAADIDHYMLFVSKEPFTDITGLQPAAFLKENQYILKEYPEKDNLLKIKDGVAYHVTVVPVDKSNNHVTQITFQKSGTSIDNTQIP